MVGLVVTAACSSYFSMISYRGDSSKMIEIKDGEIIEGPIIKLKNPMYKRDVKNHVYTLVSAEIDSCNCHV